MLLRQDDFTANNNPQGNPEKLAQLILEVTETENLLGENAIEVSMIPFADDPAGNIISISLKDKDSDCLLKNKIANSFTDFLKMLYIDEDINP